MISFEGPQTRRKNLLVQRRRKTVFLDYLYECKYLCKRPPPNFRVNGLTGLSAIESIPILADTERKSFNLYIQKHMCVGVSVRVRVYSLLPKGPLHF